MIEIHGLKKSFGDRMVLDGIDLSIGDSEIVAIMGTSGGGKSTLLRCICGLEPFDEGQILVDGVDVGKSPDAVLHRMGMVFQSAALFDFMTVGENIRFAMERQRPRKSKSEINETVTSVLEHVGLSGEQGKSPSELSGGMKKRAGLARALALTPKILLYDEPTTGLDPIITYQIDRLIAEVRDTDHVTSLLVSHDLNSVLRTADRIGFLSEGKLPFLGTAKEFMASDLPEIRELIEKSTSETLTA